MTFSAPPHSPVYDLSLSSGRWAGDYPDCISWDGTGNKNVNATGRVHLDSEDPLSNPIIEITFDGEIAPESPLDPSSPATLYSGRWTIKSNGTFYSVADTGVPFMRSGVSTNFIQHGASSQGEPGFPQLKSFFSTWGGADVYLDGEMMYEGLWMHCMYSNRLREKDSNVIWADEEHTEVFSPKEPWRSGGVDDGAIEFTVVVARWCESTNSKQVHAVSDLNFVLSFTGVEDHESN